MTELEKKIESLTTELPQGRVILVDAMNMFIRSFAVINVTTENGNHFGGAYGTLQSVKSIAEVFKPTKIVFAWEGRNASKKRREILAEYKENRKVRKSLNRQFNWPTPEAEWESFRAQLLRVKEYLETLPIHQVEVDLMEADDVIGYACTTMWPDQEKIIISSDKDYFQLITDKISVFRPIKKELIDYKHMLDTYKIHPANWIIIKVLTGDASDGISGIKGLGIKTINKLFPFLNEPRQVNLTEIFDHCQKNIGKSKHYQSVIDEQDKLKKNWEVMQLLEHGFSLDGVEKLKEQLGQKPIFKPFQLRLLFMQDHSYKNLQNFEYWTKLFTVLNYNSLNS